MNPVAGVFGILAGHRPGIFRWRLQVRRSALQQVLPGRLVALSRNPDRAGKGQTPGHGRPVRIDRNPPAARFARSAQAEKSSGLAPAQELLVGPQAISRRTQGQGQPARRSAHDQDPLGNRSPTRSHKRATVGVNGSLDGPNPLEADLATDRRKCVSAVVGVAAIDRVTHDQCGIATRFEHPMHAFEAALHIVQI